MNHPLRQAPKVDSRRFRAPVLAMMLVTGGTLVAIPSPAAAQQRGGLPADVKTAADARSRAADVAQFIAAQVKALADDKNPAAQQRARELLVRESQNVGSPASPSFLDLYATELNKQLLPLAKSPSPRVRLNAAVTIQKVARTVNNARLAEAAAAFAADDCFAVALWATKSAQSIIPALGAAGIPSKFPAAVVDAVIKHPKSGELADDAYKGLTMGGGFRNINEKSVALVTPQVLRLLEFRTGLYTKQTPPKPEAEGSAINHLTLQRLWDTAEGKKLQPLILQRLSDLTSVIAQHAAAREGQERGPFVAELRRLGAGLEPIGNRPDVKSPELAAAAKALTQVPSNMAPDELAALATPVFEAIRTKYPKTTPPPTIDADASAPPEEEVPEEEPAENLIGGAATEDGPPSAAEESKATPGATTATTAPANKTQPPPPAQPKPAAPPAPKPPAPAAPRQ